MRVITGLFMAVLLFYSVEIYAQNQSGAKIKNNISDLIVKDIDGKEVKLSSYKGKVLLIVNTASECGNTPQYEDLQTLYKNYQNKGFEVLAFPSNDFGGQEPGTNEEIKEFCSSNYHVTFPLFDKVKVLGDNKSPLYARLTNNAVTEQSEVKWNFEKFLISRNGDIVKRFPPKMKPLDQNIVNAIESELKK